MFDAEGIFMQEAMRRCTKSGPAVFRGFRSGAGGGQQALREGGNSC